MPTSLGQFLRRLRLEHGEILKTMAEKLNVTSAFLSAVENGKKKMPVSWYQKLAQLYSFSEKQKLELEQAVMESSDVVELDLQKVSCGRRDLAISFARRFESLDEETSKKILELLNRPTEE